MNKNLELELGTKCNSHCIYCEQGNNPINSSYGFLPFDEAKRVIGQAGKNGAKRLLLQGGEPTLHPNIIEIIKFAKDLGFEVVLFTNGRLFAYPDFSRKILAAGLDRVTFSILGNTSQCHDSITQAKGSFDQALKGIRNALTVLDSSKISNSCVIIKGNYQYLCDIMQLMAYIGVKMNHFISVIPYDSLLKREDIFIPYSDILPFVKKTIKKRGDNQILFENIPPCLMDGYDMFLAEYHNIPLDIKRMDRRDIIEKKSVQDSRIMLEVCSGCHRHNSCLGVHKSYVHLFGSHEFCPVQKRLINATKGIYR
ncbi:MAG: radical SAM protein [Candidatus Woesearchaeota archaeon]